MTRGRRPTPTNLKIVKGETRPSRNNADEPRLPVSVPDVPEHLTDAQTVIFLDTGRKLARMRVISEADCDALAVYAVSYQEMIEAQNVINTEGILVEHPKTGFPMENPFLKVRDKATERVRKLLAEFGMTPSSRTRVKSQ